MNHYEALGVNSNATQDQIADAYYSITLKLYSNRITQKYYDETIKPAYNNLYSKDERAAYDKHLAQTEVTSLQTSQPNQQDLKIAPESSGNGDIKTNQQINDSTQNAKKNSVMVTTDELQSYRDRLSVKEDSKVEDIKRALEREERFIRDDTISTLPESTHREWDFLQKAADTLKKIAEGHPIKLDTVREQEIINQKTNAFIIKESNILHVSPNASLEEIRKKFKERLEELKKDLPVGTSVEEHSKYEEINTAATNLSIMKK